MPSYSALHKLTTELSAKLSSENTTYQSFDKVAVANLSYEPVLEANKICVTDKKGFISSSSVPVGKLVYLSKLRSDIGGQILATSKIMQKVPKVWEQKSLFLANSLEREIYKLDLKKKTITWTLDDYEIGEVNKCIINNSYSTDQKLTITGTVSAKSMKIKGNTVVDGSSVDISTESLFINTSYGTPGIIIKKNDEHTNNIMEFKSGENNQLFTMTSGGNIGIGKTNPMVNLDIVGNISVRDGINNVSSAQINYLSGVSGNIQNQIDSSANVLLNGSNAAILLLDGQYQNLDSNFAQITQSINNIINTADITTTESITNSYNMYVTSKQNTLNFDNSLSYNTETRLLSVSKFRNVWATNSNMNNGAEYISYNNINVYNDKIELEKHTLGIDSNVYLYPTEAFSAHVGDVSGVRKTITSGTYTIEWSSFRTFGNGSRYSSALSWFDGNDASEGHMKEGSYPGGVYKGAQRIVEGYNGEWVILGLPHGIRVNNIVFKSVSASRANAPTDMRIYASYDSTNWDILYANASVSYDVANNSFDTGKITGNNSINAYTYIGICFNKIGASASTLILSSVMIYGIAAESSIQPFVLLKDLNSKHDIMNGAITSILSEDLTSGYVLVSDANGKVAASSTKASEIIHITGVSSPIQGQLDNVAIPAFSTAASDTIGKLDSSKSIIEGNAANALNQVNTSYANKQASFTVGNGLSYNSDSKIISTGLYVVDTSSLIDSNISVGSLYWNVLNNYSANKISYKNVVVGNASMSISNKEVLTDDYMAKKQDIINFSTGLINNGNTISLAPSLWTNNTSFIQADGIKVHDSKVIIDDILQSPGSVEIRKLFTNNILQDGSVYGNVKIGDSVTINQYKTTNTTSSLESRIINYLNGDTTSVANSPYCMKLSKDLWMDGSRLVWTSDIRIKKDIQDIDDDSALQQILAIEPKTYKYIDYTKSDATVYGFVSQQIESVFPQATKKTSRFIPNVFQTCVYDFKEHSITLPEGFDIARLNILYSDRYTSNIVPVYDENDPTIILSNVIVLENANHTSSTVRISPTNTMGQYIDANFILTSNESGYQMQISGDIDIIESHMLYEQRDINDNINVFVYGTLIEDLTTIDKSYIYTLNTCATQVLSRKIDVLRQNNSGLISYIESLEQRIAAVKAFNRS